MEIDVGRADLVLRRLTVDGRGTVGLHGVQVPFIHHIQLTLRDFGARVNIQPPARPRREQRRSRLPG